MIYDPKIAIFKGAVPPDSYDDSFGLVPPDDFVVSRFHDGTVASRYMDMSWNRTPYDPDGRASWLRFPFWEHNQLTLEQENLTREIHWLMFLLTWKRPILPLSFLTLNDYMSLFRTLVKAAVENSCQVKDILSDEARIIRFIGSGIANRHIGLLSNLLSFLFKLGVKNTGLVVPGGKILRHLRDLYNQCRYNSKQTPPIPTRIYSKIISTFMHELEDFEKVAESYFILLAKCSRDPLMGRTLGCQNKKINQLKLTDKAQRPTFTQLLKKYSLNEYFLSKQLTRDVNGLASGLSNAQLIAKLLIQAFSGMREDEATELPFHCLTTSFSDGRIHNILVGKTTKLNDGFAKKTRWATSHEGRKAVLLAQRIAIAIYDSIGETPKPDEESIDTYPLFVSTAYTPISAVKRERGHRRFLAARFKPCFLKEMNLSLAKIEEVDILELEQLDPHRPWRAENDFQVGCEWPFKTHQLRRSLALYAHRSGLVSLPSLRRQLQHITEEMSRYYARGSAYAINFIGDDPEHFGLEWQETAPISAALSYILNVLHSDDVLFGGHSNWIMHNLKAADGTICADREITMRRFKKGELCYRETSLGGCTNVNECKQIAIKWLDIECIGDCTNLVGRLSKLQAVISAQENLVASLDPFSVEYRAEMEDLAVLVAAREKALKLQNRKGDVSLETATA